MRHIAQLNAGAGRIVGRALAFAFAAIIGDPSRPPVRMSTLPPIPTTFDHPIAAREMTVIRHGQPLPLHVEIGQPVRDVQAAGGTDWRCPVRWRDGDSVRVHNACGIDSYQALQQALELVRIELEALAGQDGVSLQFLDCPYDAHTQLPDQAHARAALSRNTRDDTGAAR